MKKAITTLGTMTHAYQETYLSKAQAVLGDAFDYALTPAKSMEQTLLDYSLPVL